MVWNFEDEQNQFIDDEYDEEADDENIEINRALDRDVEVRRVAISIGDDYEYDEICLIIKLLAEHLGNLPSM